LELANPEKKKEEEEEHWSQQCPGVSSGEIVGGHHLIKERKEGNPIPPDLSGHPARKEAHIHPSRKKKRKGNPDDD